MYGRDPPPSASNPALSTIAPPAAAPAPAPTPTAPPPSGARWSLGIGARKLRTSFSSSLGQNSSWSQSGADLSASAPQASILGTSPPSPQKGKRLPDMMRTRSRTRSPDRGLQEDAYRPTPPGSQRSGSGSQRTAMTGSVNSNNVDVSRVQDMDADSVIDFRHATAAPRLQRGGSDMSNSDPAASTGLLGSKPAGQPSEPPNSPRQSSSGFAFLQSPSKTAKRISRINKANKGQGHDRRQSADCTVS